MEKELNPENSVYSRARKKMIKDYYADYYVASGQLSYKQVAKGSKLIGVEKDASQAIEKASGMLKFLSSVETVDRNKYSMLRYEFAGILKKGISHSIHFLETVSPNIKLSRIYIARVQELLTQFDNLIENFVEALDKTDSTQLRRLTDGYFYNRKGEQVRAPDKVLGAKVLVKFANDLIEKLDKVANDEAINPAKRSNAIVLRTLVIDAWGCMVRYSKAKIIFVRGLWIVYSFMLELKMLSLEFVEKPDYTDMAYTAVEIAKRNHKMEALKKYDKDRD